LSRTGKKAFAENEEYRKFIEFAPVGLYEAKFDPPRFVWVNEELCRILGYTREELVEMNPLDFTDEAGKQLFLEMVKRNLAGERVEPQAEFKIKTKDGKELWVSINATFTRKNGVVDGALVVAQDITERKEIERSLRGSRKKYQDLIETTSDFVWEVNAQGRYTYCSPQMEKLWGLKPAEMIGKSPFDRMSPASKAKALELFAELVKSPKPVSGYETSGHDREGRVIFYETDEVPFFDEHGRLLGFRGVTRDVTEHKKSREALQKEKSILQEVMNGTENMHLVFLDRDFNFVHVNEAYAKTCGYKPEEMIGKNHFTLYPDEEVEAIFKRVRDTGVPTEFHDRPFVFPDQPERGVTYWDWTLKPVKNGAGEVEGLVFSLVETTERKKAEEALRASEERHRRISDITTDFVFSCVKTPQNAFVIDWMAGATEKVFGYSASEIRDKGCWRFIVLPQDLSIFEEKVTGLRPGQSSVSELRVTHKDGSKRWLEVVARMEHDDSNPRNYRLFGACRDITERKKAEEELVQTQNRLSVATEAAKIGIHDYDIVANIVQWDERIREIWGVEPDEPVTYETFIENVHPDDRAAVQAEMEKALDPEKGVFYAEYRVINRKDKTVRWIYATGETFFDDNRNAVRLIGTAEDITERKKAEEVLRQQAQLLHLSYDAIIVWRKDGGIEHWNRGAEQLYGYTESEALGRVTHELLKTIHPVPLSEIEAVMRKHGQWEGELRHYAKDGREVTVSARHQLVLGTDGIERILETNRDITERKKAEEALRESEEQLRRAIEDAPIPVICTQRTVKFFKLVAAGPN
jgi:PAS domain S-box-containing protein